MVRYLGHIWIYHTQKPNFAKGNKFKYLKSQLTRETADSLAGLDINNENYDIAVEILKNVKWKMLILKN